MILQLLPKAINGLSNTSYFLTNKQKQEKKANVDNIQTTIITISITVPYTYHTNHLQSNHTYPIQTSTGIVYAMVKTRLSSLQSEIQIHLFVSVVFCIPLKI